MNLSGKAYFILVISIVVLLLGVYYFIQQRSPVKAEWWIKNVYDIKQHYGQSMQSKSENKIIILGGSNALFGINSRYIENATGLKVLNLASHMWLDLDFHLYKLKQFIRKGDIVILPLEFEYYFPNEKRDAWFNNNMIAWGDDYLDQLSFENYLSFLIATPVNRLFGLMMAKRKPKYQESSVAIEDLDKILSEEGEGWRGYSYRSMSLSGDITPDEETTQEVLSKYSNGYDYLSSGEEIRQGFLAGWNKLETLVEKYQGRLILTWPTTIRRGISDLSLSENQRKINYFKDKLASNNIIIYCNPALYNFDINLFFDTQYHLTKTGSKIRSETLSLCLKNILADSSYRAMEFSDALNIVREKENVLLLQTK